MVKIIRIYYLQQVGFQLLLSKRDTASLSLVKLKSNRDAYYIRIPFGSGLKTDLYVHYTWLLLDILAKVSSDRNLLGNSIINWCIRQHTGFILYTSATIHVCDDIACFFNLRTVEYCLTHEDPDKNLMIWDHLFCA